MKFSANLGFLFTDRALPDAIRAAADAGFDAVECHWPYDCPIAELQEALLEAGLPMLGLNTQRGDTSKGESGLAALPGREAEAQASIDQALDYALALEVPNIHVMAGATDHPKAFDTFASNLSYACERAELENRTILIEPLNPRDAPDYYLNHTRQAQELIRSVGKPNLKLMFDCYHVQIIEGDLFHRIEELLPIIGHIQFAGVPDRGEPDRGEVHYPNLFRHLTSLGYDAPLGAEYRPGCATEESLGWLAEYQQI